MWNSLYLFLTVLTADLVSKFLVQEYIPRYLVGGVGIFNNFWGIQFSLVHQTNRGAAWGIFANWQTELLYLRLALVAGLTLYLLFFNKRKSWQFPLTLILAGAIGNILDYYLYGHVIDMLHFVLWGYDYPVFNLADSAIFIGIAWLLLLSWLEKPHRPLA